MDVHSMRYNWAQRPRDPIGFEAEEEEPLLDSKRSDRKKKRSGRRKKFKSKRKSRRSSSGSESDSDSSNFSSSETDKAAV